MGHGKQRWHIVTQTTGTKQAGLIPCEKRCYREVTVSCRGLAHRKEVDMWEQIISPIKDNNKSFKHYQEGSKYIPVLYDWSTEEEKIHVRKPLEINGHYVARISSQIHRAKLENPDFDWSDYEREY